MDGLIHLLVAVGQSGLALLLAPGRGRADPLAQGPAAEPAGGAALAALPASCGSSSTRKSSSRSNASWLFRAAPFVIFASTAATTVLVPVLAVPLPFDTLGDLVVLVYLLLLGTFVLALAGLDPGSAFGGMGASREVTVAALAEPTVALAVFALALGAGSTNLGRIVGAHAGGSRHRR